MKILLLILVGFSFYGCNGYPKDPMQTLDKVRGDTLKVCYSDNGIWVKEQNSKVEGIEAKLIKEFSASNGIWVKEQNSKVEGIEAKLIKEFSASINAEVKWIKGTESELMPLLNDGEYHVYIAGLTESSPWKKQVGFSRPYMTSVIYIGVSEGTPLPDDLKGIQVAVKKNSSIGKYVKKKGGIPKYTDSLAGHDYIATYEWEMNQQRYRRTNIKLHEEKQVIAVPQGENAFLMELEKFLDKHVETK